MTISTSLLSPKYLSKLQLTAVIFAKSRRDIPFGLFLLLISNLESETSEIELEPIGKPIDGEVSTTKTMIIVIFFRIFYYEARLNIKFLKLKRNILFCCSLPSSVSFVLVKISFNQLMKRRSFL